MLTNSDDDPDPASVATASTALIDPQTDYPTIPLADTCIANANDSAAQSLLDELTESQRNYQRFARLLPFNTTDPEVQQRQETLLSLLFTNNICTEQNFKIFIAEPDAHEAEASRILEDLYVLNVHDDMDTSVDSMSGQADGFNDDDDVPMSPASQISTMTLGLVLDSPSTTSEVVAVEPPEDMFPIFQKASNCIEPTTLRDNSCSSKPIKWKPIGDKQYQLDAGQKQFGGKMCSCGMFYAVHEPEDEALHQKYHDIYAQLAFKVDWFRFIANNRSLNTLVSSIAGLAGRAHSVFGARMGCGRTNHLRYGCGHKGETTTQRRDGISGRSRTGLCRYTHQTAIHCWCNHLNRRRVEITLFACSRFIWQWPNDKWLASALQNLCSWLILWPTRATVSKWWI